MENNLNVVNDAQDPSVEGQNAEIDSAADAGGDKAAGEVASPFQTIEANQTFAAMRKERDNAMRELERAKSLLSEDYGKGEISEVLDAFEAEKSGKTVEEIKSRRQTQEEAATAEEKAEYWRQKALEARMRDDLREVQKLDPKIKSIDELGEDFVAYLSAGLSIPQAYNALQATKKTPPPTIGKVGRSAGDTGIYTLQELKDLSKEEIHKNWEKVQKTREKLFK